MERGKVAAFERGVWLVRVIDAITGDGDDDAGDSGDSDADSDADAAPADPSDTAAADDAEYNTQLRSGVATALRVWRTVRDDAARLESELAAAEARATESESSLDVLRERLAEEEAIEARLQDRVADLQADVEAQARALELERQAKQSLREQVDSAAVDIAAKERTIHELQQSLNREKVRASALTASCSWCTSAVVAHVAVMLLLELMSMTCAVIRRFVVAWETNAVALYVIFCAD
jgi:hypothetical protein